MEPSRYNPTNMNRSEHCERHPGTLLIDRCQQCGAPVCCPKCCDEIEDEFMRGMSNLPPYPTISPITGRNY